MRHLKSFLVLVLMFSILITMIPSNIVTVKAKEIIDDDTVSAGEILGYDRIVKEIINKVQGSVYVPKHGTGEGIQSRPFISLLAVYMKFKKIDINNSEEQARAIAAGVAQGIDNVYGTEIVSVSNCFSYPEYKDINGTNFNSLGSREMFDNLVSGNQAYIKEHAADYMQAFLNSDPNCGITPKMIEQVRSKTPVAEIGWYYTITWKVVPYVCCRIVDDPKLNTAVAIPSSMTYDTLKIYKIENGRSGQLEGLKKSYGSVDLKHGGYGVVASDILRQERTILKQLNNLRNGRTYLLPTDIMYSYESNDEEIFLSLLDRIKGIKDASTYQEGLIAQVLAGYGVDGLRFGFGTKSHICDCAGIVYKWANNYTNETGQYWAGTGYYGYGFGEDLSLKLSVEDRYYYLDESGNEVELAIDVREDKRSVKPDEKITYKPLTESEMKYKPADKNCESCAFKYTNFRKDDPEDENWYTDVHTLGDKLNWISTEAAGGVKGTISKSGTIRFNYLVEQGDILLKVKDVYYDAEGNVLETVWRTPEEGEQKSRDDNINLKSSDAVVPDSIKDKYADPKLIKTTLTDYDAGLTVSNDYTTVTGKMTASNEVTFMWQCVPEGSFKVAVYDLYLDANTGKIIGRSDESNPSLNKEAGPVKRTGSIGTTLVLGGTTANNVIDINYDTITFPYDADTREVLKANFTALFHKDRLYRGGVKPGEAMYEECKDEPTTVLKYVVGGFGLEPNVDESYYKVQGNGLDNASYDSKTTKPNFFDRTASGVRWNGVTNDFWLMYVYEVDIESSVKVTDVFVDSSGKEIERIIREDWSPKVFPSLTEVTGDIKSLTKAELEALGYIVDGIKIFGVKLDTTKTADQTVKKKIAGAVSEVKWCNSGNDDWRFIKDETVDAESITVGGKVNASYEVEFTYIVDTEPKGFTIIDTYNHYEGGNIVSVTQYEITWNEERELSQCCKVVLDSTGKETSRENIPVASHIRGDYIPVKKGTLINSISPYTEGEWESYHPINEPAIDGSSYKSNGGIVTGTYLTPTLIHYTYEDKDSPIEFKFAVQPQQYEDPMNPVIAVKTKTTATGYLSIHLNADNTVFYGVLNKTNCNGQYWPVEIRLRPSGWSVDNIDIGAVKACYGNGNIYNSGELSNYANKLMMYVDGADLVIKFEIITEFLRKWVNDELYVTIDTAPFVCKSNTPEAYDIAREWGSNNQNHEYKLTLDYLTEMLIKPCPGSGLTEGEGLGTAQKPSKGAIEYTFVTWSPGNRKMTNTYYDYYEVPEASRIPWRYESTPNGNASVDAFAEIIANQVGKIISKDGKDVNEDAADWSVMAGVPSTENLCIAIGGTAWVVDAGGWIWIIGDTKGESDWDNAESGWHSGPYGIRRTINIEVVIQDIWGHSGEGADDNNWLNLSCGCGELVHQCQGTRCYSGCSTHTGFCGTTCSQCGGGGSDSCSEQLCAHCGGTSCCGCEITPAQDAVYDDEGNEVSPAVEAVYCACGAHECNTPHVVAPCVHTVSATAGHHNGRATTSNETGYSTGSLNAYNQIFNGQTSDWICPAPLCGATGTYAAPYVDGLLAEGYTEPCPSCGSECPSGAPYHGCTANAKISCVYPGDNVFNFQIVEYLNVYSYRTITAMRLDALCTSEITDVDTSVIESSAIGMSTTNADMSFDMWRSNAKQNGYQTGNGVAWFEQFADKEGSSKISGACYRGTVVEGIPNKMYSSKRILWVPSIRHQKSGNAASDVGVGGFTYNDYYPDDHMTDVQKKKTDDPWQSPYYWLGDCRVQITICATADPSVLEPDFAIAPVSLGTAYWGKENELFRPTNTNTEVYKNHTGTPISVANQQRLATHVANAWQCANNNTRYTINIVSDNLFVNAGGQRFEGDMNCKDVIADVYGVDAGIKLFDYEFKGVGQTHTRTHGNVYGDASSSILNGVTSHAEVFKDSYNMKLMTFGYIGEPYANPEEKYTYAGSGEMKDKDHTLTEGLILMSGESDKWGVMLDDFQNKIGVNFAEGGIEGYDESKGYRGWRGISDASWRWSPYTPYIAETNYAKGGRIGDFTIVSSGSPGTEYFKGFWDSHIYPTKASSMMTSKWGQDVGVSSSVGKSYGERCNNSGMLSWNYQWTDANGGTIGQQSPMQIMNIDMVDYCKNGVYSDAITVTNKYYNVLSFNNDTAMPYGSQVIADDNLRKDCVYTPNYSNVEGRNAINDIVIHDPISVEYCQLIPNNYGAVSSIYAIDESNEDMRTQSFLSYTDPKTGIVDYTTEMIPNADRNDYIVLGNTFYVWSSDFGDFNNNMTGHGQSQVDYEYNRARYELGVNDTAEGHKPDTNHPDDTNHESDGYVYSTLTEDFIEKREIKFSFPVSYINTSGVRVAVDKETWINLADVPIEYEGYGQSDLQNFRADGTELADLEYRYGRTHMFTCLESADETKKATVTFRTTSKNNHGDTEESQWLNNVRDLGYDADGVVIKECYTELVGRIGNLSLADTTDFRTSAIVKVSGGMGWLIEGVVFKADETTSRSIISTAKDILLDNSDIRGLHTYSTTNYADSVDTSGGKSGRYYDLPLNSLYNEGISDEYIGNEMKLGYNLLMDIETMGEYEGINTDQGPISANQMAMDFRQNTVEITPLYMLYDYDEEKFYPMEFYAGDLGHYYLIWKAGVEIHRDVASLYTNLSSESPRRNVTPAEWAITRSVLACHPDSTYVTRAVLEDDDFIGTCSKIVLDQYNRTYIGSSLRNSFISTPNKDYADSTAYGKVENMMDSLSGRSEFNLDTQFFPTDDRLTSKISDYAFAQNMQRYHFTLGLPSSTVGVLAQEKELKTQVAINKAIEEMKAEHPNSVVIVFATIEAHGDVWDLTYDATRTQGGNTLKLYGCTIDNYAYAGYHTDASASLMNGFMVPIAVFDPFTNATTDLGSFGSH